jgi:tripartite-type tricarboxylate transporter receptor subunit TctC
MIDRLGQAARYIRTVAFAVAAMTALIDVSRAQPASDFYRGKTISIVVGTGDSGAYVINARILARHWAKYIPGNPTIIVQSMSGGGGLRMAGWFHHVAQKDGTVVGMPVQTVAMSQVLEPKDARYDVRTWNWLGILTETRQAMMVSPATAVRSMEDARKREVIIGSTAPGGNLFIVPKLTKELAGAKFKIILGYRGGADLDLGIANGELQGRAGSWNDWKQLYPDWAKHDNIVPLALTGMTRDREAPDLPLLREQVSDPVDQQVVDFFSQTDVFARSFALPPGTPQAVVELLRTSFAAALNDEQLIVDITRRRWAMEPRNWQQVQQAANDTLNVTPAVVARMHEVLAR